MTACGALRGRARTFARAGILAAGLAALLLAAGPGTLRAQTDCLSCHADQGLQNAAGHSVSVDGQKFASSLHGSLKCGECHTTIKEYPHPDTVTPVKCETCHADQAAGLAGSVHSNKADHPCTSCHGDAHSIFPKSDPRSAVYPLNVPRTCGACHGNDALAKKHGLPNIYPMYIDSIHGIRPVPPTRQTSRRPAERATPASPPTTWAAYMERLLRPAI
jgi:hypothetical protein